MLALSGNNYAMTISESQNNTYSTAQFNGTPNGADGRRLTWTMHIRTRPELPKRVT